MSKSYVARWVTGGTVRDVVASYAKGSAKVGGDYVFSKAPNEEFINPLFGKEINDFQPGRPEFALDIWGWFWDGIDMIFNPRKYAPAPSAPAKPDMPAYAMA